VIRSQNGETELLTVNLFVHLESDWGRNTSF
jgi:hypothetical protein